MSLRRPDNLPKSAQNLLKILHTFTSLQTFRLVFRRVALGNYWSDQIQSLLERVKTQLDKAIEGKPTRGPLWEFKWMEKEPRVLTEGARLWDTYGQITWTLEHVSKYPRFVDMCL